MVVLIAYIIKSIVASGVLYGWYLLALRNKKFHIYNRFYLLAVVVISLVIPFVRFEWYTMDDTQVISIPATAHRVLSSASNSIPLYCIGVISCLLLIVMFLKIAWVYRIKRRHGYMRMGKVHFIETTNSAAPFSFLNNLFWRDGISRGDDKGDKILKHEMAHIRQRHTYDKLFLQMIACICWMNPFYWLIQKELNMVHEFMADAAAIEDGDTGSFALMLLQSHDHGRYLDPAHYFSRSPVIRRLNMIASSKSARYKYARKFLGLPLIAILLLVFTISATKAEPPSKQQMEMEQKLQDEKRAQESKKPATSYSTHTSFIRYRYWTFI